MIRSDQRLEYNSASEGVHLKKIYNLKEADQIDPRKAGLATGSLNKKSNADIKVKTRIL